MGLNNDREYKILQSQAYVMTSSITLICVAIKKKTRSKICVLLMLQLTAADYSRVWMTPSASYGLQHFDGNDEEF
jgi:hypothetical protein